MAEKYQPQDGEVVEVVLRGPAWKGVARHFCIGSESNLSYNVIFPDAEQVVSIKKVEPPLPTMDGSVIRVRFSDSMWLTLILDGGTKQWRTSSGRAVTSDPHDAYPYVEIVHDAGRLGG